MYNWKDLPDHSRVWVYQAGRKLSGTEQSFVLNQSDGFINNWAAHGEKLQASAEIFHDLFFVLFVNEEQAVASGCSIDKSVHFVQELENQLGVDLMNRLQIAYRKGDRVEHCTMQEFEKLLESGEVNENTIVFNNVVTNLGDFRSKWETPVKESWHSRLLPKV